MPGKWHNRWDRPQELTPEMMSEVESLFEDAVAWSGYPHAPLLTPTGVAANNQRNNELRERMFSDQQPRHLVTDLPTQVAPNPDGPWHLINDLIKRHEGEVRELAGLWEQHEGPLPRAEEVPDLFHYQFALCWQDYADSIRHGWKGQGVSGKGQSRPGKGGKGSTPKGSSTPAVGGNLPYGSFGDDREDDSVQMLAPRGLRSNMRYRRSARVCGLADLFSMFGNRYTAAQLYLFYCRARLIVTKRLHAWGNEVARASAQLRHGALGQYGFSRRWDVVREQEQQWQEWVVARRWEQGWWSGWQHP